MLGNTYFTHIKYNELKVKRHSSSENLNLLLEYHLVLCILTGNKDQVLSILCNFCQVNQVKYEKCMSISKKNGSKWLKTMNSYLCHDY